MRKLAATFMISTALAATAPAKAQNMEDVISGLAQSLLQQEMDKNAFASAQSNNTIAAYRDYLAQYPNGVYRANAERALTKLGDREQVVDTPQPGKDKPAVKPSASAAAVEAAIGLSRNQRATLQQQLTALGYATGGADGLWGANTRSAIGKWQQANKENATGYVTEAQIGLIAKQAGSVALPSEEATDYQLEEQLLGLTGSERREIQRRLTALGYSTYGSDGVFGRNTRRALEDWQRDEGLQATGYITADQLRELRRQSTL